MDKKLNLLFKDMCCSRCKQDFDEASVEIVREEPFLLVVRLVCQHCNKSFGMAFLGLSHLNLKNEEDLVLKKKEDLPPITTDDVINAHNFIKNLDEHWQKYLP